MNYIHKKQNTIYYQKFNVAGDNLYNHQYMSNINAPASESKIRSNKATPEELKNGMTFIIPVYKEMPETPAPKPSETGNNNNFLDSLTVDGFTLSPTFDRYKMEYAVEVTEETTTVLLETMAGKGSEVGGKFEELKMILDGVGREDMGVCLDTCHVFDGGYDGGRGSVYP